MADDFSEWASDAPLRTPDGFSEVVTAAGVAVSAIERNEMLAYASRTFVGVHEPLLRRILAGYQSAKRLQLLGMAGYVVAALVVLAVVLALPLQMEAELRPFSLTGDSFPKIIVRRDTGKRWYDEKGILNINLIDFLLDKELI